MHSIPSLGSKHGRGDKRGEGDSRFLLAKYTKKAGSFRHGYGLVSAEEGALISLKRNLEETSNFCSKN